MAELVEISGLKDGSGLGTGFVRLKNAHIPWKIHYYEVLVVIEGELRVHANNKIHELFEYDSLWLPAGSNLIYEAKEALITYAIHPSF
jgi:ethanolamine utilization protein EutQ